MARSRKVVSKSKNIVDVLNDIGEQVNSTLNKGRKERYFQSIVLLYSVIENLLKWLVYMKVLWKKSSPGFHPLEEETIREFATNLRFYSLPRIAYVIGLIDYRFFRTLDAVRKRRNDLIHQFWLLTHLEQTATLRRELEELAKAANRLIGIFNKVTKDIGVEEVYDVFLQEPRQFRS